MSAPRRSGTPARRPVRRRRVPPYVFWVRRGVVLGVVGGLVWAVIGVVGLLDLSMDGSEPAQATTTAADSTDDEADAETRAERRQAARRERRAARLANRAADAADPAKDPGKAMPTGPCADSDVVVTPTVPDGHAGGTVEIVLELTTLRSPACTWQVDPGSVFVTITKGTTTLWSSQHCPGALPRASAVPRRDRPDRVSFDWSGKESQPGCTVATDWVWPGTYTINAVARGSVEAVEASFALGHPEPAPVPEPRTTGGGTDAEEDRRDARREERQQEREEKAAREQAAREQARRDALEQAREARREERREERRQERVEKRESRQDRSGD